jgi:hypothetical protein
MVPRRPRDGAVAVLETANTAVYNMVGGSIANLYTASPFAGASYGIDAGNVYIGSPDIMIANGIQVADVFIGSPTLAEFSGINAYNVYIGPRGNMPSAPHAGLLYCRRITLAPAALWRPACSLVRRFAELRLEDGVRSGSRGGRSHMTRARASCAERRPCWSGRTPALVSRMRELGGARRPAQTRWQSGRAVPGATGTARGQLSTALARGQRSTALARPAVSC